MDYIYTDSRTHVRVHCEGSACWADVRWHSPGEESVAHVDLQFLLQPRDDTGLPRGAPLLVCSQPLALTRDQATGQCRAWSWLPASLGPALLPRCHVRLGAGHANRSAGDGSPGAQPR